MTYSIQASTINPQELLPLREQGMLVVIDPSIADSQHLAAGVLAGATVLQLDPDRDGIVQIDRYLQCDRRFTSLHILCHGAPGSLYLGSSKLTLDNLEQYAANLQQWGQGNTGDREIFLYGCQVAKTARGCEFVKRLSDIATAPIAASMDLTGSQALGGTWELAYQTGKIQSDLALQPEVMATYAAVLAVNIADGDVQGLIDAITAANNGGDSTINLASNGTYEFTNWDFHTPLENPNLNRGRGALPRIDKPVVINGNNSIIRRNGSAEDFRLFYVDGNDSAAGNLTLNNVILENGKATLEIVGGVATQGGDDGGAIFNDGGVVTLENSTIRNNTALDEGGAIANLNGQVIINGSTINSNISQGTTTDGGVLENDGANARLIVNSSTLSGNQGDQGGAIRNRNGGTVAVNNSTITQNTALTNGGGIYNDGSGGTFTVRNSILAGNTGPNPDVSGAITGDANNLIGNTTGSTGSIGGTNDIVDTRPLDQILNTTLAANGLLERDPFTHALATGSPAIDAGDSTFTTDQRGAVAIGVPDIGAYETGAQSSGEVRDSGGTAIADNTGSVDFGSTSLGTTLQQTFTIASTGTLPLSLSGLTLPTGYSLVGSFPGSVGSTNDPDTPQTQTFTVQLDASSVGTAAGELSFTTNDSANNPYNFALTGVVTPPAEKLQLFAPDQIFIPDDTGTFQFGTTTKDEPLTPITFTLRNTDSNAFTLSPIALPTGFSLVGNFPTTIAANSDVTFSVQLDASTEGSFNGELSFMTDDATLSDSTYNFNISGTVNPLPSPEPGGNPEPGSGGNLGDRLRVDTSLKRFTTGSEGGGNLKLQLSDNGSDRITQVSIVYLNESGDRTLTDVLFTALPARFRPNGFNASRQTYILEQIASNQSFEIELQTIDGNTLIQEVSFAELSTGRFQVDFTEGISLFLEQTTEGRPLGVGSIQDQGTEFLDLREISGVVTGTFSVYREANFNNSVGFFLASDENGMVNGLTPGDNGYAEAAIENRLTDIELFVRNQSVNEFSATFAAGSILIPFIITNGTAEQFLANNAANSLNSNILAYFPFIGANPDQADHIRLLANNTFGFEDLRGGGDQDFNDTIVATSIVQI
ncbi:MAG: DUF4347 domain-containing protein [Cyanobacteria bacterium P01_E01_bin.42]